MSMDNGNVSIEEVAAIVHELNFQLLDKSWQQDAKATEKNTHIFDAFSIESNGDTTCVLFLGYYLWDNDNDGRECLFDDGQNEEFEDLEDYLRREANKILTFVNAFQL